MKTRKWLESLLCACGLLLINATAFGANTDEDSIRRVIAKNYDRPDKRVVTAPVAVVEDYAIADWLQGKRGGRALLQRGKDGWSILACGGDGFRDPATLVSAGIPENKARQLTTALESAEKLLPTDTVKRFGLFDAPAHHAAGRHH